MSPGADRVRELVERVVEALGVDGRVEVDEDGESIAVAVRGGDPGLLIGRHGQTIDAVQHLAYRVALDAGVKKRVSVDAGGYRDRRAAVVRHEAERAADDAIRLGRPVAMEPMSAVERRLAHEVLRDRGDVDTHSEGEEPERRLVVSPRD